MSKPLGGKTETVVASPKTAQLSNQHHPPTVVLRIENTQRGRHKHKHIHKRVSKSEFFFFVDYDPMDEAAECCIWGLVSLADLHDLLHPGFNSSSFVFFLSKF